MPISTPTNSLNMAVLRKRAKKLLKKKHGVVISLSQAKKIWDDYCEYDIIRPLLKFGKVQIDERTSIEIVGTKYENDPKLMGLMTKGLNGNGHIKKAVAFDSNRMGVKYKIVFKDKNYKDRLIFEPNAKLSKRVHEELKNTQTYYTILR